MNAAVWRIHAKQSKSSKHRQLSLVHGRSMCPKCSHTLAARDLIPVLSWLSLGGRCRYCHKGISWQYPAVELFTTGLFLTSYYLWPYDFDLAGIVLYAIWLALIIGFMIILVYDLRWMIIPNKVVWPLIGASVLYVLVLTASQSSFEPIIQAVAGVLISSGIFYVLFQVSKGAWIGGGDVRLGVAIGLIIGGATNALMMLFLASLLGCLASIPLLLSGAGRQKKIPFGPCLILATFVIFLTGASISAWYQANILYI